MGCFIGFSRVVFLVFSSLLVCSPGIAVAGRGINPWDAAIKLPTATEKENSIHSKVGTRWAVLVAGSSGYGNYRHQADVCHAYQLLRKGGLKEKNIIVFMYDDIANSEFNPRPGTIINKPKGKDVYAGVPKDYTGEEVNTKNLYAVLLGNKSAVEGGSGKVVKSKANDRIFIYYSDHGGPGVLGMPDMVFLYAADFIEVLKKKHEAGSYKEMVIYVEACESGSIFEGILPDDLNIYVTTASNAEESSYGTYCPGMDPPPPPEFETCLGDLYSVSWMEDSETHNLKKETLQDQFEKVKDRTSNNKTYNIGSHVMEYGNTTVKEQKLYLYQGSDPANENITENELPHYSQLEAVNQRDADLLFLWQRYKTAEDGSEKKAEIFKEIADVIAHRIHLDRSVDLVGNLLFGTETGPSIIKAVRPSGQPLVDDWDCLKAMVRLFVSHCGPLNQYGMKHMRAFANVCNQGTPREVIEKACAEACSSSLALGAGSPVGRDQGA